MALLSWHLVPEITRHLTATESRFLVSRRPVPGRIIMWGDLILSFSLCQYVIKRRIASTSFLFAMLETAPLEAFVLPVIARKFKSGIIIWHQDVLIGLIDKHRSISILAHMFKFYEYSRYDWTAVNYCGYAAGANNTEALAWLRDPNTGNGTSHWTEWTCLMATTYGHFGMLQRLRDPDLDGGVCPWNKTKCLQRARDYRYTAMAEWIEAQPDDD